MTRDAGRGTAGSRRAVQDKAAAPAPESLPWTLVVALAAAAGVVLSVSNRVIDPDLWQHLAVGKAIWQLHRVPTEHLWTWPLYGTPDVLPSWLFRFLLWPLWSAGEVVGLFAWRWIVALAAFAVVWATARRMGARGFSVFVVIVLCSLVFRRRSVRPEALAGVLLGLTLWILESHRRGDRNKALWLVPVQWLWINAHISYFLGFALMGIHALATLIRRRPAREAQDAPGAMKPLLLAGLAAFAVSFLNPFGWRALWQPFDFFLHARNEPIFRSIGELGGVAWEENWTNGLPLLLVGWPVLILWRGRRRGWDLVEILSCLSFTALTLMAQRFMAFYALVAAPFVARDLSEWLTANVPPRPIAMRAGAAILACAMIGLPEWTFYKEPLGIRYEMSRMPVAACDFIEREGVRGHAFNQFHWGGYMLHRFWPDRDRLPFMDIHQSGSPETRLQYILALVDSAGFGDLDARWGFDWVLLNRPLPVNGRLLDVLDSHPDWALVFVDDPAALYVRRRSSLAAVASRFEYQRVPGGNDLLESLRADCKSDSAACAAIVAELERAVRSSPRNAVAHGLLANIAMLQARWADARGHLRAALGADVHALRAHERLALIALEEGRPEETLREVELERRERLDGWRLDRIAARAHRRLGDLDRARAAYRRVLRHDPNDAQSRDSLEALGPAP